MTSMQGTLLLQLRMSVKMTLVAPLSTSRSQHTGDSLVAPSESHNTHSRISGRREHRALAANSGEFRNWPRNPPRFFRASKMQEKCL